MKEQIDHEVIDNKIYHITRFRIDYYDYLKDSTDELDHACLETSLTRVAVVKFVVGAILGGMLWDVTKLGIQQILRERQEEKTDEEIIEYYEKVQNALKPSSTIDSKLKDKIKEEIICDRAVPTLDVRFTEVEKKELIRLSKEKIKNENTSTTKS